MDGPLETHLDDESDLNWKKKMPNHTDVEEKKYAIGNIPIQNDIKRTNKSEPHYCWNIQLNHPLFKIFQIIRWF